ncbi:MAG: hypothetical protein E7318_04930 [Clostridiales bacterium]|nr:hypothetical protein [Clostridiales bacterium]
MRLYETTSTVTQNEIVPLRRYAHTEYGMTLINGTMLFLLVLAVIMGVTVYREDPQEAINCVLLVLALALVFGIFGRILLKYGAKQAHPYSEMSFTHTTWYDGKRFHRLDTDGDEFSWLLRKMRYAWRNGTVVILCTASRALIPVNLLQLSEAERQSFFDLLKSECPKLVALE